MRLSRKNDSEAVSSRQRALGVPEVDLESYAKAAESVFGNQNACNETQTAST